MMFLTLVIGVLSSLLCASTSPIDLPKFFSVSDKYPNCTTVHRVHDQGTCSSWGYAVADTFADRICVRSEGQLNPYISAEDIITCGTKTEGTGCTLGTAFDGWEYVRTQGVTSGGPYNSLLGCKTYSFPPCGNPADAREECHQRRPRANFCERRCDSTSSLFHYFSDPRYYVYDFYPVTAVDAIKREIYENGSVQTTILAYADFFNYTGGVYQVREGILEDVQAVRLIGWGKEEGEEYWLGVNTWGKNWGVDGKFKIRMHHDECGVESNVLAGNPML